LVFAAIAGAWLFLGWSLPRFSVPVASFASVAYTTNLTVTRSPQSTTQTWLCAEMVLKNAGRSSFLYWATEGYPWARAQTPTGWVDCVVVPDIGKSIIVDPGSNVAVTVMLPQDTVRWQCGLSVQAPSIEQRVGHRVNKSALYIKLYPVSGRLLGLLPSQKGTLLKIKSTMFEVNQKPESPPHNERSGVDAGRPSLLSFVSLLPGATHRER
jgi:hypothetical protein